MAIQTSGILYCASVMFWKVIRLIKYINHDERGYIARDIVQKQLLKLSSLGQPTHGQ